MNTAANHARMPQPSVTFDDVRATVRRHWGFEDFLPHQQEAIECVLAGRDSVVVLPTGGGKSLSFQAPAVCQNSLAVVVSPLISLMKDQVDALRATGVAAACVNSSHTAAERSAVAQRIRRGELNLLYLAPERLVMSHTLEFLGTAGVAYFAIDEAHCISSWGHDFRPEYRALAILKQRFPAASVHAYTATATERVRADIAEQLHLAEPRILVGSFDRPNLVYRVRRKNKLFDQVEEVVGQHAGESGIVYCITRNETEATAAALTERGHRAVPYHAGMQDHERRRHQEAFLREEVDVIVATVAFGMGIDKSNVRFVVHAGMPKSLEAYQQESGRAGRDGLEAECVLFYSGGDFGKWKSLMEADGEPSPGAVAALGAMYNYATAASCRHRALVEHFGQSLEVDHCQACDICLGDVDQVDDPLTLAQKIISCVARLEERDERFGAEHVAQILAGSREERILSRHHDRLTTYGLLADENKRSIRDWIEQLAGQGCLERVGEYHVLAVTELGWQVLRGEHTPRLLRPAKHKSSRKSEMRSATFDDWEGVDRGLFESLRHLRRDLASELQAPAYIVFGDAALRDMARRRPSDYAEFLEVKGVGEKKAADYAEVFLKRIQEYGET